MGGWREGWRDRDRQRQRYKENIENKDTQRETENGLTIWMMANEQKNEWMNNIPTSH